MKLQENQNFINFWEFLEIPMNSPIGYIKVAFASKFEKIKNSIESGESKYSLKDLKTCVDAYETLRDPYSRFLHNCEIDGEEPPENFEWDSYFSDDGIIDEDLSEHDNKKFLAWLLFKITEFNNSIELYMEIVNKLYGLFIKEKEKQEKNDLNKRNNKTINKYL